MVVELERSRIVLITITGVKRKVEMVTVVIATVRSRIQVIHAVNKPNQVLRTFNKLVLGSAVTSILRQLEVIGKNMEINNPKECAGKAFSLHNLTRQ